MLKRIARLILFFAAVQILGGHWAALQSVAWIGMLAEHTRGENLISAIEKTFDGAHPCGLCKVVKSGRDEEQKQQVVKMIVKLDAVLAPVVPLIEPPAMERELFARVLFVATRSLVPPTPPPRVA